ncbi:MAG: hypothetical protein ABI459_08175 [Deltaproteobacteria bacterium]
MLNFVFGRMNRQLQKLTSHFTALDHLLSDLKAKSDSAYQEGGLIWNVKYARKKGLLAQIDGSDLRAATEIPWSVRSREYKRQWARLIFKASATYGRLNEISGGADWDEEEERQITEHEAEADQVIELFGSAGANICVMSFVEEDTSLGATCSLIFSDHILTYDIFWSVD